MIELCAQQSRAILFFSLPDDFLNREFTKRDTFHYMGLDEPRFTDAVHITASFFVCRKTPFTVAFFQEWLH